MGGYITATTSFLRSNIVGGYLLPFLGLLPSIRVLSTSSVQTTEQTTEQYMSYLIGSMVYGITTNFGVYIGFYYGKLFPFSGMPHLTRALDQ